MKVRVPKDAGGPSVSSLKKMQKMQDDIQAKQDELAEAIYEAASGGGAVKVVATGSHRLKSVVIDPDVVDADDVETLQDLICAAVNEVFETADKTAEDEMSKIAGNISIPGMF